ncbi:MAG: class I SAM-dependent methyltransferase [Alphaproteobacteria bacterium]|nr:class I SAM-dependent methyltransferase [Alphaproteobacteria bacterium]
MATWTNIDWRTVEGFGREWAAYDQSGLDAEEHERLFAAYFSLFAFDGLGEGFDLGCGSGRWAKLVAPRVGHLHCIDPAGEALAVARRNLADLDNVSFHRAASDAIPLPDDSQDFGYSIGVLHHIPDAEAAMRDCVRKLKPGAQLLVYLYYRLDGRPAWFRALWRASDLVRKSVSRLPFRARKAVTDMLAGAVYFPLARLARLAEAAGLPAAGLPLYSYRNLSFYAMRTDALDRFGTSLEQRFTRGEIAAMMGRCGLVDVAFREEEPYWVAVGRKRHEPSRPL